MLLHLSKTLRSGGKQWYAITLLVTETLKKEGREGGGDERKEEVREEEKEGKVAVFPYRLQTKILIIKENFFFKSCHNFILHAFRKNNEFQAA